MSRRGGQPGNRNAAKAKVWTAAINRALEKRTKANFKAIDDLAEKLLLQCDEGDMTALKELGDRLEGKPAQVMHVGGDEDNPVITRIERVIIRPED